MVVVERDGGVVVVVERDGVVVVVEERVGVVVVALERLVGVALEVLVREVLDDCVAALRVPLVVVELDVVARLPLLLVAADRV